MLRICLHPCGSPDEICVQSGLGPMHNPMNITENKEPMFFQRQEKIDAGNGIDSN